MDPTTIALLIGLTTLIIERFFTIINKIKSSKCFNTNIIFNDKK